MVSCLVSALHGLTVLLKDLGHVSGDLIGNISNLGEFVSYSSGIHRGDVFRETVKSEHILGNVVSAAQDIGGAVRNKGVVAPLVISLIQVRMSQFLRQAAENIRCFETGSDKNGLILRTIDGIDMLVVVVWKSSASKCYTMIGYV